MTLVVFGLGYSSEAFCRRVRGRFPRIVGTVRSAEKAAALAGVADAVRVWPGPADEAAPAQELAGDLADAEALLVSVPPGPAGDPVLAAFAEAIAAAPRLRWIGYLSTIGVYGDHDGAWIDETTPPRPASARSRERLSAEEGWLALGRRSGVPVAIVRLAGIYGPGRGPFAKLRAGTARRIVKPGQVFNRIHVEDIAAILEASLDRPRAGAVYNGADGAPAPPEDVLAFAAELARLPVPPAVPFEQADMTPMARSFYGENKRVACPLLASELGLTLRFPDYRAGLRAVAEAESAGGRTDRPPGR